MNLHLRVMLKIIFLFPFLIGVAGFLPAFDYHLPNAMYASINLYMLNMPIGIEVTPILEVARWSAALAVASGFFIVVRSAGAALLNFFRGFSSESCAVYGDSFYARHFLKVLGRHGLTSPSDKPISIAQRHILLFDTDEENLKFYAKHMSILRNKKVYLLLNEMSPYSLSAPNLHVFNMAEHCARLYWKENPAKDGDKIAIIGFGSLGQKMLMYGLLLNIFSPNQCIEYHIWGENSDFRYHGLHFIKMDKIRFRGKNDEYLQEKDFTRFIFCADDTIQNLTCLSYAASMTCCKVLHVYTDSAELITPFSACCEARIVSFGTAESMFTHKIIFEESLLCDAKALHNEYMKKHQNIPPWEDLSGFFKRSNVSSADYREVLEFLKATHSPEVLAELEHIRWCRFHYLHNWTYAEIRNDERREHNLLLPYSELSEEEKQKCRDIVNMV